MIKRKETTESLILQPDMGFSEGGLEEMPNSLDHGRGELEAFPRTFLQD